MTCKVDSHKALYEELGLLEKVAGVVLVQEVRKWSGRHYEVWRYRWAESLPLRATADTLYVNWCELTISHADTGAQPYHSAWVTDHVVDADTAVDVVASGRNRWKVENEGINVLKQLGYDFEHNSCLYLAGR